MGPATISETALPQRIATSTVVFIVFAWLLTGLVYAALMGATWLALLFSAFQNSGSSVPGWADFAYSGLFFTPVFAPFSGALAVYRSRTGLPLRRFGSAVAILAGASWGWLIGFIAATVFIPGLAGAMAMFAGFVLGAIVARSRVHAYNLRVSTAIPA